MSLANYKILMQCPKCGYAFSTRAIPKAIPEAKPKPIRTISFEFSDAGKAVMNERERARAYRAKYFSKPGVRDKNLEYQRLYKIRNKQRISDYNREYKLRERK
jgi:hypothetical protein